MAGKTRRITRRIMRKLFPKKEEFVDSLEAEAYSSGVFLGLDPNEMERGISSGMEFADFLLFLENDSSVRFI